MRQMSGTTKVANTLPEPTRKALQKAYAAYDVAKEKGDSVVRERKARAVADLAIEGILAGWPMSNLAEPCDITPERLRQIVAAYGSKDLVAKVKHFRAKDEDTGKRLGTPKGTRKFPLYDRPKPRSQRKSNRRQSVLSKAEAKQLGNLSALARQNTGHRALDSEFRVASEEFSTLIMELHDRGVIWQDIAEAANMTISGVRLRAARHGYGKGAPPSMKAYERKVLHQDSRLKEVKPPKTSADGSGEASTAV